MCALFVLFFSAPAAKAQPVDPPDLYCLTINPDATATLEWNQPADPNGWFDSYRAFWSTDKGGPYTSYFTTQAFAFTNFTGIAVPNTGPVYFYMQTFYDDGTGLTAVNTSDTLNTVFLTVTNEEIGGMSTGWAELNWNEYNSAFVTPQDQYMIYRQYVGEPTPTLIDSVPYGTTYYRDNNKVCKEEASYQIRITDSGCAATSNIATEIIEDANHPGVPLIDSVSVDTATGMVLIGWAPTASQETEGYIVYNFGSNPQPDTIWGIDSLFAVDSLVNAGTQSETYGVAAFDTCWVDGSPNTSPTDILHTTVHLSAVPDPCERTITLTWSEYQGWPGGAVAYRVYGGHQDSAWTVLANLSAGSLSFVHDSLTPNTGYHYFVRAVGPNGVTSTSNLEELSLITPNLPQYHYLKHVTVDRGKPQLECFVDEQADISYYSIQRSTSLDGEFVEVDTIMPTDDTLIEFRDRAANADSAVWYYRIVVIDVCGNEVVWSNPANTMNLQANIQQETLDVTLDWSEYEGWDELGTGISLIEVYRYQNGAFFDTPIASLPGSATSYTDNVTNEFTSSGQLCYYVQAIEGTANPFGYRDTSRSNMICVFVQPRVYIPNAFTPNSDGLNDVWLPGLYFTDVSNYQCLVFDRWGQAVYSSTDPAGGWDGTIDGNEAASGLYMYRVFYRNGQGQELSKTGHLTLMR